MISVEEAYEQVLSKSIPLKTSFVEFTSALGHILAEDIVADQDFPPFNRVMMDGIALDHRLTDREQLPVAGMQPAGAPQQEVAEGHCIEVMTGAILPKGTDIVIPYELTHIEHGVARFDPGEYHPLQNVHLKGTDRKQGDLLIPKGRRIGPPEIAILATVGKTNVLVATLDVAIVSTGDELVDVGMTPGPYQIRKSNTHALDALIREAGFNAHQYHLEDDLEATEKGLTEILARHEVVILSGGVSRGKKDYVPEALDQLGVSKAFHRVAQRPGKPFWFGTRGKENIVFALPGNPVSTVVCFHRYVLPWLAYYAGRENPGQTAILGEEYSFPPSLTCFLQVRIADEKGQRVAYPVAGKGSGDLANLLDADGFLVLPSDRSDFSTGEILEFLPVR